jgi:hypothetical protein
VFAVFRRAGIVAWGNRVLAADFPINALGDQFSTTCVFQVLPRSLLGFVLGIVAACRAIRPESLVPPLPVSIFEDDSILVLHSVSTPIDLGCLAENRTRGFLDQPFSGGYSSVVTHGEPNRLWETWHPQPPRSRAAVVVSGIGRIHTLPSRGVNQFRRRIQISIIGAAGVADYVRGKPTGRYARIVWWLFETMIRTRLDLPDVRYGNYVDLCWIRRST